jgi:hypothetical protein
LFIYLIDVFIGLCNAIDRIKLGQIPNADEWHKKIKNWYSWYWVAEHTEIVYKHIIKEESINLKERIKKFVLQIYDRKKEKKNFFFFYRYKQCGFVSGLVMSFVAIISYLIFMFLDYNQPKRLIDLSIDYPKEK